MPSPSPGVWVQLDVLKENTDFYSKIDLYLFPNISSSKLLSTMDALGRRAQPRAGQGLFFLLLSSFFQQHFTGRYGPGLGR